MKYRVIFSVLVVLMMIGLYAAFAPSNNSTAPVSSNGDSPSFDLGK